MTELYECCEAFAPLFRRASRKSPLETQLVYGEVFNVKDIKRGWAFGEAQSPIKDSAYLGYQGYVALKFLRKRDLEPNMVVTALSAPVFAEANIKTPVAELWPMNARFRGRQASRFYQTDAGFLHQRHVRSLEQAPAVSDFVTIAEQYLGRPYIWGGVVSDGLDCSGLVQASLRAAGKDAPRDSVDQEKIGRPIPEGHKLCRGDLIFWKGHVGIMRNETELLHANAHHMAVASEPLETAISRISETGGPVTARRRLGS